MPVLFCVFRSLGYIQKAYFDVFKCTTYIDARHILHERSQDVQNLFTRTKRIGRQKQNFNVVTRLKIITCSRLLKTGCNNVVLPTLFIVVNNIVQHC